MWSHKDASKSERKMNEGRKRNQQAKQTFKPEMKWKLQIIFKPFLSINKNPAKYVFHNRFIYNVESEHIEYWYQKVVKDSLNLHQNYF